MFCYLAPVRHVFVGVRDAGFSLNRPVMRRWYCCCLPEAPACTRLPSRKAPGKKRSRRSHRHLQARWSGTYQRKNIDEGADDVIRARFHRDLADERCRNGLITRWAARLSRRRSRINHQEAQRALATGPAHRTTTCKEARQGRLRLPSSRGDAATAPGLSPNQRKEKTG